VKISIGRLKEIIMEEVARATMEQKVGPCEPGETWEPEYEHEEETGRGKCVDLNEDTLEEGGASAYGQMPDLPRPAGPEPEPKSGLLKFLADLFGPIDPEDAARITALASDMHDREIEKHGPFGDLGLGESLSIEIVDDE